MQIPMETEYDKMTPMMRQYYDLKKNCMDSILFFRMGDFYEVFAEDAETIAPQLELVLTSRERGDQNRVKFCGVPHHSAQSYWLKLLKLNYKIAVADQVESADQAKGLVKRAIVKRMSPGCIVELEGLKSDRPNYIMAAYEEPKKKNWAIALADISTAELRLGNVSSLSELVQLIEHFSPRELLARKFIHETLKETFSGNISLETLLISQLPETYLKDLSEAEQLLSKIIGKQGMLVVKKTVAGGCEVISALFNHFQNLGLSSTQFLNVKELFDSQAMQLDDSVIKDLELFETTRRRQTDGSLFSLLNQCQTPMGSRLLRWNLARPLVYKPEVKKRHILVKTLIDQGHAFMRNFRDILKGCPDLERLLIRALGENIRAYEMSKLRDSLRRIEQVDRFFGEVKQTQLIELTHALQKAKNVLALLEQTLCDVPGNIGNGDEIFKTGYDSELDEKNLLSQSGQQKIDEYQSKLRANTKISSLKIKTHKSYGLLIEVTKVHLAKIPEYFVRRQTMVNCERFTTEELKNLEEDLIDAKEQAIDRESYLFVELIKKVSTFSSELRQVVENIAYVDMLGCFAWSALQNSYCQAHIDDEDKLKLQGARHPTVEKFVGTHHYIPAEIELNFQEKQMLITGPNMAGKSTVMRLTALCAIMNQIGSYVPAHTANLPIFDKIFTRVGAADDLSRGMSTFMVEMAETAELLRHASPRSLVILDEVGRGTSSQDGLAIAAAILEELAINKKCWTMFATHFHELVPYAKKFPMIKLSQVQVRSEPKGIIFTHKLVPGASGSSYGIEVARLAGLPAKVIVRAEEILVNKEQKKMTGIKADVPTRGLLGLSEGKPLQHVSNSQSKSYPYGNKTHERIVEKIRSLSIHKTTPIQALNIINEMKDSLQNLNSKELFHD